MPGERGAGAAAVLVVARQRLRRRRAATVLLLVVVGLTAATPMALWSAARRTGTAVDRFVEEADVADATVIICPPGHDPRGEEGPGPCFEYEQPADLGVVRSVPGVTAAARFGFRPVTLHGRGPDPELAPAVVAMATIGPGSPTATALGNPVVVAGRLAAPTAPDEVMLAEPAARSLGLGLGDRVAFASGLPTDGAPPPPVEADIVGVVRTPDDLLPLPLETAGGVAFHARAGWIEAHDDELPGFDAMAVWLDGGRLEAFLDGIRPQLPDQEVVVEPAIDQDDIATMEHATSLESRAGVAVAVAAALAVTFFVGQTVSRQSRAEADDGATLVSLGMTRRQLVAVPLVRWLSVAVGGALLAVAGTIGASALGPIGVARRGPWDRGPSADWPVLAIGAVVTAGLTLTIPVVVALRRSWKAEAPTGRATSAAALGPPGLRTGAGLAWASLRRGAALPLVSAVAATGVALAAVVTAAGGAASLRLVTDEPRRFGSPWHVLAAGGGGFESTDDAGAALSEVPGVASAAGIAGTDVSLGEGEQVWVQALLPLPGVPTTAPVIVSGRAPRTSAEIALGSTTLRDARASLGDEVSIEARAGEAPLPFRVVGVAMVTDGYEPHVGKGAIVTPGGLDRVDPSAKEEAELGMELAGGLDDEGALDALRRAVPGSVTPFPVPASLANAERIAGLPVVLAAGGAVLAGITFVHALITSVHRNRRELAVCRVIGFTRRQVHGAVATQATLLALAAVLVGLPLGVVGARWGWRAMARSFGVVSGPLVPVWLVLASAVAALVVANVAAGPPSRWTTRRRPAEALHAE